MYNFNTIDIYIYIKKYEKAKTFLRYKNKSIVL